MWVRRACVGASLLVGAAAVPFTTRSSTDTFPPSRHSFVPQEDYIPPPTNLQLKQVLVFVRHGDSSGIIEFDANREFWAQQLPDQSILDLANELNPIEYSAPDAPREQDTSPRARLTKRGVAECVSLGSALRRRYVDFGDFMSPFLKPSELIAYSTNTSRTQHSAQMILMGLFPDISRTREHWTIPVVIRSAARETLLPNGDGKCGLLFTLLDQIFAEAPGALQAYPGYDNLEEKVRSVVGYRGAIPWAQLREIITCHDVYDRPLPDGVNREFIDQVIDFNTWLWDSWYVHPDVQMLSIGRLINETLEMMKGSVNGTSPVRMGLFTTHDNTIFPIKKFFEIPNHNWPLYASTIVLELAQDTHSHTHFVRVLHNDRVVLQKGTEWLRWDEFHKKLRQINVDDEEYQRICSGKPGSESGMAAAQVFATMR
eukprot:c7802_g1_i5.p1 GENE.c7802_g1_i5~~c7802_g1_i5.p1  ORF type:complete len:439 (-),score=115.74 c7802_g1_i5:2-1285(-)